MILSELIPFLKSLDVRPKKSLSQNFLIDTNITRKVIRTAEIQPGDSVLEIGPGPGALTLPLLEAGAHVYAIEKDAPLAHALERLQTPDRRLTIFHADALSFSFDLLPRPLKVVANLPYHITTPLLETLFERASYFSTLTLIVQKELADRLAAKPSTPEFSSLTLFAQFYTSLKSLFPISKNCLYPRPRVDSTVVHLEITPPPLENPAPFFTLVRRAFQQRRKMLRTSLKELYPQKLIDKALQNPQARPEELSLSEWIRFFNEISSELSVSR